MGGRSKKRRAFHVVLSKGQNHQRWRRIAQSACPATSPTYPKVIALGPDRPRDDSHDSLPCRSAVQEYSWTSSSMLGAVQMSATRLVFCRTCRIEKAYPDDFYEHRRICAECFCRQSRAYFNRRKRGRRRSESAAWDGASIRATRYHRLLRYFSTRKGWYEVVIQIFFRDRAGYSLDFILRSLSAAEMANAEPTAPRCDHVVTTTSDAYSDPASSGSRDKLRSLGAGRSGKHVIASA